MESAPNWREFGYNSPLRQIYLAQDRRMPLYEYACRDCDRQFELLIRGSETPHCPSCDSRRLDKLLSVPSAPSHAKSELPMCQPSMPGGCGLPQCGLGGCAME